MSTLSLHPTISSHATETRQHLPVWKRSLDLACCLLALPGLILLTLLLTIHTRLVSPGPVLFRQQRIGWKGRRFQLYKFRTMHVGADNRGHQRNATDACNSDVPAAKPNEPGGSLFFPGGGLLHASGLAGLPQIVNVLRGEMSVVGPRPCLPSECEGFLPWQRRCYQAMPGLTGMCQVSGQNRATPSEMAQLDIHYAETASPWLDGKIILLTVPALLRRVRDTARGRWSAEP